MHCAAFCQLVFVTGAGEMQYLNTPVAGTYMSTGDCSNGKPKFYRYFGFGGALHLCGPRPGTVATVRVRSRLDTVHDNSAPRWTVTALRRPLLLPLPISGPPLALLLSVGQPLDHHRQIPTGCAMHDAQMS